MQKQDQTRSKNRLMKIKDQQSTWIPNSTDNHKSKCWTNSKRIIKVIVLYS